MSGIYIHIPFCKQRCSYCDFFSSTDLSKQERVLTAIVDELEECKYFLNGDTISTIYIGGGTPSVCTVTQIGSLIEAARDKYRCSGVMEVTMEANPDDLSPEYLSGLRGVGVNRLSIGIQSFMERDLQFMNRRHDAIRAKEAVKEAQRAGFDNITIDLIYGISAMSNDEWRENIEIALSLGVQHISAYHLSIEEGTPFGGMASRGELSPIDEEDSQRQYLLLGRLLAKAGFDHYEISNFALPGYRALHNSGYWSGTKYLGVGPSAHSFDGNVRHWNVSSIEKYVAHEPRSAETLSDVDKYNEYVMLSLRTSDGVDITAMRQRFCRGWVDNFIALAEKEVATGGLIRVDQNCYRIPESAFLTADTLIGKFFL